MKRHLLPIVTLILAAMFFAATVASVEASNTEVSNNETSIPWPCWLSRCPVVKGLTAKVTGCRLVLGGKGALVATYVVYEVKSGDTKAELQGRIENLLGKNPSALKLAAAYGAITLDMTLGANNPEAKILESRAPGGAYTGAKTAQQRWTVDNCPPIIKHICEPRGGNRCGRVNDAKLAFGAAVVKCFVGEGGRFAMLLSNGQTEVYNSIAPERSTFWEGTAGKSFTEVGKKQCDAAHRAMQEMARLAKQVTCP